MQSAQNLLRDRLSQAYPAVLTEDSGDHRVDFAGGPDTIEFLGPLAERFGAKVFVHYRLYLDGGVLRLAWSMTGKQESDGPAEASVIEDLSAIAISYYGVDDPADPPHWHDSWQGRKGLPPLIRIQLSQHVGETAAWTELTVAPLVTADASCVFDVSDGACRGL